MTDLGEKKPTEKRSPQEIFSEGMEALRQSYDKGAASLETQNELFAKTELATLMLALDADGKIVLPKDLKAKASEDLDRMLDSIKATDVGHIGETVMNVLAAMKEMSQTL
jgi:uncharacterized protein YaaN involved in tellurite resistance